MVSRASSAFIKMANILQQRISGLYTVLGKYVIMRWWCTVFEYKLSRDEQFFFRRSEKKIGIYLYNLPMSDAVGTSYHHI